MPGDAAWTDYRLCVRLISDTERGIGVMVRYQDANNYYRFSKDRAGGYRRLIKKVGGAVTTLWQDAVKFTVGREYAVTIDCVDEHLAGSLDGVPLFSAEDASVGAGRIGLYRWSNTGRASKRFGSSRLSGCPTMSVGKRHGSPPMRGCACFPAAGRMRLQQRRGFYIASRFRWMLAGNCIFLRRLGHTYA